MLLDKSEHYRQLRDAIDKEEDWRLIHQNYSKHVMWELSQHLKNHNHDVSYWSEHDLTRIYINHTDAYIQLSVTGKRFNVPNCDTMKIKYFNQVRELVDEIEYKYLIKSFALPGYLA